MSDFIRMMIGRGGRMATPVARPNERTYAIPVDPNAPIQGAPPMGMRMQNIPYRKGEPMWDENPTPFRTAPFVRPAPEDDHPALLDLPDEIVVEAPPLPGQTTTPPHYRQKLLKGQRDNTT